MVNASPRSLPSAAKEFLRYFSPRVLVSWLAIGVIVRVAVGDWRWSNLIVVATVIAAQPFVEWTVHVFLLHAKPQQIGDRQFDTVVARDHRLHHQDPRDIPLIFIPRRWVAYLFAVSSAASIVLALALGSLAQGLTLWLTAAGAALTYEWVHFLIHTDYKPKSRIYRHVYSSHRLHHFRNEHYWFGVTSDVGDRVLGTNPAKAAVEISPTARDIARS